LTDISKVRYKVITYRKGMVMSTDWCYDWLEAEEIAADRMAHPALYDEVRILNVQEKQTQ
jgi:hypothetical protein